MDFSNRYVKKYFRAFCMRRNDHTVIGKSVIGKVELQWPFPYYDIDSCSVHTGLFCKLLKG